LLNIEVPLTKTIVTAAAGERVEISGIIYTARDAIMPKICKLIEDNMIDRLPIVFEGAAILHTAVSQAGFGPTSSNKAEIEGSMGLLSKAGVKMHIGKGAIKQETVDAISKYGAVYVVVPPVSALLQDRLVSKRTIAYQEEGMEALYELKINNLPGIIAAANGVSIFA
jgi:fumarate hydratase subunit beta